MNTYDIIVPLGSSYYEKEDRQSCLVLLRQCKIRRILLILNPLSDGVYNGLADDIAFFTENGMEVMVWLGETLGHGVALAGQKLSENKLPYMRITGIMDKSEAFAFCPLDPKFQEFFWRMFVPLSKQEHKAFYLTMISGYPIARTVWAVAVKGIKNVSTTL